VNCTIRYRPVGGQGVTHPTPSAAQRRRGDHIRTRGVLTAAMRSRGWHHRDPIVPRVTLHHAPASGSGCCDYDYDCRCPSAPGMVACLLDEAHTTEPRILEVLTESAPFWGSRTCISRTRRQTCQRDNFGKPLSQRFRCSVGAEA